MNNPPNLQNKTLATVNGQPITQADVMALLYSMGQNGAQYNNEEGYKLLLNQLIEQKLFLQDAKRNLYEADPVFQAELQRLKEDALTSFAISKAVGNVTVSDAEVEQYYKENPDKCSTGEMVNADHILVESEQQAKDILSEINSGNISFADAAKKYSTCPSSQNGGNLGDFGHGQMVPEFDRAVFSMNEGEITGPVKTQFGYHLIRLNKKKPSSPLPFAQIKEQLRALLIREKQQKAYESKVNQLKLLYPVDLF